jgi:broad specificity phosphatase PhoE
MDGELDSSILNIADDDNFHAIIMVGLPGRGKSYMSYRMTRWLNWKGFECEIFNAGNLRRKLLNNQFVDHNWFNAENESYKLKEKIAEDTIKEMILWLQDPQNKNTRRVGIFDATNSTLERRAKVVEYLSQIMSPDRILFVESICNDEKIIHQNFIEDKRKNDDYINLDSDEAINDFSKRVVEYTKVYQQLESDQNRSFVKIYNLGQRFIINNLTCNFQKKIAYFLFNLNKKNVTIYMTRHGQSEGQTKNIIGGNSDLTENGKRYAQRLKEYFDNIGNFCDDTFEIMCSQLKRSKNTAKVFNDNPKYKIEKYSALNEINGGEFENLSFDAIKEQYPDIYRIRNNNKYHCAWPNGESYYDLTIRLEPILMKIENTSNKLIIIAHQAICRIIYAYLMNITPEECVNLEIKSHRLFEFNNIQNKREVLYYDL